MKIPYILKFIFLLFWLTPFVILFASKPVIRIGDISFTDADWDFNGNLILSQKRVSDITSNKKAVVLHFFTAQTC